MSYNLPTSGGVLPGSPLGARVRLTAAQTLTDNTTTPLSGYTVIRDDGGFYNAGNPTRLTIPTGKTGWFIATGQIRYALNAVGFRGNFIRLNGATILSNNIQLAINPANFNNYVQTTVLYYFSAGDFIELEGFQNSTGNLDVEATDNETWFSIIPAGRL